MYCSGCGNQLQGHEKFCPECGKSIQETQAPQAKETFKTLEFSSNILLGGSILAPDKIIINNTSVVYKKRNKYLIGTDESSIPFNRISSVEINRKLIQSHVIIYSTGNQKLIAKNFSVSDAKEIKKEIERRINII
jgi:hypothetical protein